MLDQLLDFFGNINSIAPAVNLVQGLLNGPSVDFGIPAQAGWTKRDIKRLLSQYGVKCWGLGHYDEILTFTVPKAQARWTYYLLERQGIPIAYAPAEAIGSPRQQDRKLTNRETLLDHFFGFLDRIDIGLF